MHHFFSGDFEVIVQRLLGNSIYSYFNQTNKDCRDDAASILSAAGRLELWALKGDENLVCRSTRDNKLKIITDILIFCC